MRFKSVLIAVLVLLGVSGCSRELVAERTAPEEAVTLGKKTVGDLRARNVIELRKDGTAGFARSLSDPAIEEAFRMLLPGQPIVGVHVESWTKQVSNIFARQPGQDALAGATQLFLRYEFAGGEAVRMHFTFVPVSGHLRVVSMNLTPLPAVLRTENAASAHWMGLPQLVFLAIGLLLAGFVISTAISCLRTPGLRFKWLWFIVIWIGGIQISMRLTDAKIFLKIPMLNFPPTWIDQLSPYDPAWAWFMLPLGALAFRGWRKRWGPVEPSVRTFVRPETRAQNE